MPPPAQPRQSGTRSLPMPWTRQAGQTITGSAVAAIATTSTRPGSGAVAADARTPQWAHAGRRRSAIRDIGLSVMDRGYQGRRLAGRVG